MNRSTLVIACLTLTFGIAGCVNTRVEYFTDETYPTRSEAEPVQWLAEPPTRPYLEVARVTVTSASAGEETLRASLLDKARKLGADAVLFERPVVVRSAAPTPYYDRSILGPMGAAFGLYGYGWYTPYSSNPYILVQGAVDQPREDHYLSGVVIRYETEEAPPTSR